MKSYIIKIFSHPDCTVGFGVTPNHALRLAGFTAGRESHPALKIIILNSLLLYSNSYKRKGEI